MTRLTHCLLTSLIAAGAVACDGDDSTPQGTADIRMTKFVLGQDPGQPAYLNHRIPVSFELTGTGHAGTEDEPAQVAVTFSFIEPGGDPVEADGCSSNAIVVPLTADDVPQAVNAFIWPTTDCEALVGSGRELEVLAEFFMDDVVAGFVEVDLPILDIMPGKVDVEYGLSLDSSVALLHLTEDGKSRTPSLLAQSSFVFNGRDPYVAKVTAEEIPDALRALVPDIEEQLKFELDDAELDQIDALPGTATIQYTLSPESDPGTALSLTVGEADGSTSETATVDRVDPGIAMQLAHNLYIEGDSLDALSAGGDWADETAFVLRGCMQADFEQELGDAEDCKEVAVELVRETGDSNGANTKRFERRFQQLVSKFKANVRINLDTQMDTTGSLDPLAAFIRSEGGATLSGKLGRSFDLTVAGFHAEAELDGATGRYDMAVVAFDQTVFSESDLQQAVVPLTNDESFGVDKAFKLGAMGIGFGPATIGITVDVGGRFGIDVDEELRFVTDAEECAVLLNTQAGVRSCGQIARSVTPNFGLTMRFFGGLNLRVVKAGIEAELQLLNIDSPQTADLNFGITEDTRFFVRGDVNSDLTYQLINGRAQIVGSIGFRRFRRSRRVNVFSFDSPVTTLNLLNATMVEPLELF